MKVGDAVRFSNSNILFAVIIKEREDDVALMFRDGDVTWLNKNSVESIGEES
jgi:hypothetical protein